MKKLIKKYLYEKGWVVHSRGELGYDLLVDMAQLCRIDKFGTVFDVGANAGQSMLKFLDLFPHAKIYCFEPCQDAFDKLAKSADGRRDHISLHQLALANEQGEKKIKLLASTPTNSLLATAKQAPSIVPPQFLKVTGHEVVHLERLENFVALHGIHFIDFLKIDTQGFDLEVLKGAGSFLCPENVKFVKVEILFEFLYENQCQPEDIIAFMREKKFKFMGLYDCSRHKDSKSISWCDALFVGDI